MTVAPSAEMLDLAAKNTRRVGLISNPHSGRNRRHLQRIESVIAGYSNVFHYPTQTQQAVAAALSDMLQQNVDVIAINGGDGTMAGVVTALRQLQAQAVDFKPVIALLPGGTTNMNAADTGMSGNLVKVVKKLCAWSEAGPDAGQHAWNLLKRPLLKVSTGADAAAVYGMFFGTGAIIQGIEYCHASIHAKGVGNEVGPGLAMLRTVWGLARRDPRFSRPVNAAFSLDDGPESAPEDMMLFLVSSLERLFLGMRPYWGSEKGALHVSMIRDRSERFLRTLPSLLRGRPGPHVTAAAGYRSHNADHISLRMNGTFTLDGEMYQASTDRGAVQISNGGEMVFLRL